MPLPDEDDEEEGKDEDKEEDQKEEDFITLRQPIPKGISSHERQWRQNSVDYEVRFCGHCNTTTDIKEANFFGRYGRFGRFKP